MSGRPVDPRSQVSLRNADGSRGRSSRPRGIRITPTRVILVVALLGSAGFFAYALTVRDATQIPLLASSAIVLGLVLSAFAVTGFVEVLRAGREARAGRATLAALFGGLAAIAALGCFAGAAILALLS